MKSIYLKSVLAFIFVGVMAMIVCIPFYIVYLAQQPATPEQLTEILQETPCAAEAFQETLKEGANKQVISSQADSLIKISRIWADFFPANTSNQPI